MIRQIVGFSCLGRICIPKVLARNPWLVEFFSFFRKRESVCPSFSLHSNKVSFHFFFHFIKSNFRLLYPWAFLSQLYYFWFVRQVTNYRKFLRCLSYPSDEPRKEMCCFSGNLQNPLLGGGGHWVRPLQNFFCQLILKLVNCFTDRWLTFMAPKSYVRETLT